MTDANDYLTAHERAAPMSAGPTGPLTGIRIVDLTRALAGPFCTMLLADMGADVIKIEPPESDMARYSDPFLPEDEDRAYGGYFASINRNKRSVVLDLKDPTDRVRLLALVDRADVVVENFRAGVMDRLDLGYETLRGRNPRLVYAAIRGFGDPRTGTSPYADWPAFDVVAQAMGGVVSFTGTADEPVVAGPSIGDLYPATVAVVGVLSALHHARATGQGQFVDVAMVDALVALSEAIVWRYSYTGVVQARRGSAHAALCPFAIYATGDGACAIAAPTAKHWELLCGIIDRPDLVDDERTRDNRARVQNSGFVKDVLEAWTTARTTAEVVDALAGTVPVGPVNDAADLFADPHVRSRQMLVAVDHPGAERPVVFPNTPLRFTETPGGVYRRAPKLGEHTDEVLTAGDDRERNR